MDYVILIIIIVLIFEWLLEMYTTHSYLAPSGGFTQLFEFFEGVGRRKRSSCRAHGARPCGAGHPVVHCENVWPCGMGHPVVHCENAQFRFNLSPM